ncbi:MAG TPA: PIN domain-containing protein [Flavisolibacter sp.]|jgi:predicted nucleic acid-binding protein
MDTSAFLDSSVVLYAFDKKAFDKSEKAFALIRSGAFVSPQVLFETLFVLLRKVKLTKAEAVNFIRFLLSHSLLQEENKAVVENALAVFSKYNLQSYDSKIVAAALVAGCATLYSEDMQHGLVIENSLTILNPFL